MQRERDGRVRDTAWLGVAAEPVRETHRTEAWIVAGRQALVVHHAPLEAWNHMRFAGGHSWMQTTSKRRAAIPAFRNSVPTCLPMQQAAAAKANVATTNTVIWNFLINYLPAGGRLDTVFSPALKRWAVFAQMTSVLCSLFSCFIRPCSTRGVVAAPLRSAAIHPSRLGHLEVGFCIFRFRYLDELLNQTIAVKQFRGRTQRDGGPHRTLSHR